MSIEWDAGNRVAPVVGLGDRAASPAVATSGGEQQRVAIARSLVNSVAAVGRRADRQPRLPHQRGILAMFEQLNRLDGITIILVTHDPTVAGTPGGLFTSTTA